MRDAAERLVELRGFLAAHRTCPLFLSSTASHGPIDSLDGGARLDLDNSAANQAVTAARLIRWLLPLRATDWGPKLQRIHLAAVVVKERVKWRYEADEARRLSEMSTASSRLCGTFWELDLNRPTLRGALQLAAQCRALQVTLRSILCAARFDIFLTGDYIRGGVGVVDR